MGVVRRLSRVPEWLSQMNDVTSISQQAPHLAKMYDDSAARRMPHPRPDAQGRPKPPTDAVELSAAAAEFDGPPPPPPMDARVAEIRQQIADGSYLTEDKLEVAVDRLFEMLTGLPPAIE